MPWKEVKVDQQRMEFIIRASEAGANLSRLCREYGISRPTGYRWLKRYRQEGHLSKVREYSRRPHHTPTRTPAEIEAKVIALRERFKWGARKLQVLLQRQGLDLPIITIHRIIQRHGMEMLTEKGDSAHQRFEYDQPNQLLQMDFKGPYPLSDGQRCYPLSILDDHSRYAMSLTAHRGLTAETVWEALEQMFQTYGVPEKMLMDHGTPWWSTTNRHGLTWLSVKLIKQGIKLCYGRIAHPQTQGKVERFHRTLKEYLRSHGIPQKFDQWPSSLLKFLEEYNHLRPHEALNMLVPGDRYRPSDKKYQPHPPSWNYSQHLQVDQLNSQGMLSYGRQRYFVCEALAGETVGFHRFSQHLLIQYRDVYVREIDLCTGRSSALFFTDDNFPELSRSSQNHHEEK